jgi:hypothetical protein
MNDAWVADMMAKVSGPTHIEPIRRLDEQAEPSEWYWVQHEPAAQALVNPLILRCFSVFLSGPIDLHEAAQRLGLKRTTLRYHVRRFVQWGLLMPNEPSSGRERLRYRAVNTQLYIPFQASGQASLEELLWAMEDPHQRAFLRSMVRAGDRLERDSADAGMVIRDGSVDFTLTAPPQLTLQGEMEANLWSSWTTVNLTPSEASALKTELAALWARYVALEPGRSGTRPHTLRLGFTPDETG